MDHGLKYTDGFKGRISRYLFGWLIPDFCFIDDYNSHIKSQTSGLYLELLPIHIVSILELKVKLKDSDVGRLLHYLRIVLDYSPSLCLFVLSAIADFHDIRFATLSRSNDGNNVTYLASLKEHRNENEHLLKHLAIFFTADPSKLGFCRLETLPHNIRIHDQLLRIGANSMVFNFFCNNDLPNEYALKIRNKSVDKEIWIHKLLHDDKYKIIQVHQYALLFQHPSGRIISKINLLSNINIIWNQIKKALENKIVNRDIRRSNIIEIFNNETNR